MLAGPSGSAMFPMMLLTLGLYYFWRRATAFVMTTERLVVRKGILNTYERSLPLRFVQDGTVTRDWSAIARVRVSTARGAEGVVELSRLSPAKARRLADTILDLARRATEQSSSL